MRIALDALPYPPVEMRKLVRTTDQVHFKNPEGKLLFNYLDFRFEPEVYERVFDFGCGCGRLARQLILQKPQPIRYVGVNLFWSRFAGASEICDPPRPTSPSSTMMSSIRPSTRGREVLRWRRFLSATESSAWQLLTRYSPTSQKASHLLPARVCRIIDGNGFVYTTWFLFEKQDFPMMQEARNALYVSYQDPSFAVIFDRHWLIDTAHQMGLRICAALPPSVRGHQWTIILTRRTDLAESEFPVDDAPRGWVRPPMVSGEDAR